MDEENQRGHNNEGANCHSEEGSRIGGRVLLVEGELCGQVAWGSEVTLTERVGSAEASAKSCERTGGFTSRC